MACNCPPKPVVIRLASGAEFGARDAETAQRAYPDAEIIRYQDGTPYVASADLTSMNRGELDAYAEKAGVEGAASMPNKAAVIAAIEDAS